MDNMNHTFGPGSWIVMCRVSGGVTGTRDAPLKANGQPQYFPDEASAKAEASRLMSKMNTGYRMANFQYWAEAAQ